jgi:hypothetical protein
MPLSFLGDFDEAMDVVREAAVVVVCPAGDGPIPT